MAVPAIQTPAGLHMTSTASRCKKTYLRVPPREKRGFASMASRAVAGAVLSPWYFFLAGRADLPGLGFAGESLRTGLRSLAHKGPNIGWDEIYRMVFWPI